MTELILAGSVERPLTHMALLGLASILDGAGVSNVSTWFSEELRPRASLRAGVGGASEIGELVQHHAARCAEGSWVTATVTHEGRADTGTMSPRLKEPGSRDAWSHLQSARHAELDLLTTERALIDLRMIAGLGEPGYWIEINNKLQPDRAASRWEMKTRNRGEEFVGNRLAPLARAVAKRTGKQVLDGLIGSSVEDETGKNSPDSRSATGLAPPGPADSALAWCALWGLACFPVAHRVHSQSRTAGAYPVDRIAPRAMILPVTTAPTSIARFRAILRSAPLDQWVEALVDRPTAINAPESQWLEEHGVRALMRFPVEQTGSASAPERRVLDGEIVQLGAT